MNRRAFMRLIGAIAAGPLVLLPTPAKAVAMDVDVNRLQGQTQTLTFYDEVPDRQSCNMAYYVAVNGKFVRLPNHVFATKEQIPPGWEFLNDPEEDVY